MSACSHKPFCIRQGQGIQIREHDRMFPCKRRVNSIQYLIVRCRSKHFIHLWYLIYDLLPITLGKTSCHDKRPDFSLLFILRHLKDILDALFFRVMDKTAGVDYNNVSLSLIICHHVPS